MQGFYIGFDVGTVSVKAVAVSNGAGPRLIGNLDRSPWQPCQAGNADEQQLHIYLSPYRRVLGNPMDATESLLDELLKALPEGSVSGIGFTGSGARLAARKFGARHYSEFKALATGVGSVHPQVDAILEMGGENSKFIEVASGKHHIGILDYGTNGDCAAGTGSFLDQQASRLCYNVEEIGALVAGTEQGAKIAGRCSVFAKSDMIHAQQKGSTPPMVLKGLCEAVARNFKGNVAKGRELKGRTAFVGGVAQNQGVFTALRSVFGVENGQFFVPEAPAYYAALGAALLESKAPPASIARAGESSESEFPCWPPLSLKQVTHLLPDSLQDGIPLSATTVSDGRRNAFLGIDIGSVSTNLVLMDEAGLVIHEVYLRTKARPVEVVRQGLEEVERLYGKTVRICGAGTTGSGRELIGELVAADCINDEITAHKTGADHVAGLYLDQPVDTIFEIGGQDAKFIQLNQGVVVDFTMNEACAAGTGSFLEEQAEKLGVNIVDEFSALALSSRAPLRLGERCTVYMEMDVTASLRKGAAKQDVIAGLAYSVAQNYLNRVVRGRSIGETIFFQGGTAYNRAVAAAFADILGKQVIVPPHNGVMGAYGMALLAREKSVATGQQSSFRGFDLDQVKTSIREFTCKACSNHCDIKEFTIDGVKTYWGDKCSDRYRRQAKVERQAVIEDLVGLRREALERNWLEHFRSGQAGSELQQFAEQALAAGQLRKVEPTRFGLLRAMYFYQRFPFWRSYLEALGDQVCVTETTTKQVADAGVEAAVAEFCFPIQVAHGHLSELRKLNPDRVILPAIVNEATSDLSLPSHVCPWGQTLSATLRHSPAADGLAERLLEPLLHFREGERFVEKQLWEFFKPWAVDRRHHRLAVKLGYAAQSAFQTRMLELGKTALAQLERSGESGIVLVGRPYNVFDPGMNLNLAAKLRKQYGVNVIPIDCIPCSDEPLDGLNPNMYWNYGRRILQAALWSSRQPHLHLIYLTNFMCGPDSFVKTFAADGSGKPFLTLQFDGHGNDAGMMTRCEAYLDSKGLLQWWKKDRTH
jgi:predicted CoA-substrate-specific enzyme activase